MSIDTELSGESPYYLTILLFQCYMDYYTPPNIIKAAKEFYQSEKIDVDLCSDSSANTIVQAEKYYTNYAEFNPDLVSDLNIWCNPPYDREFITPFFTWYADRIPASIDNGCQILTLVNVQSSAKWFHVLMNCSDAVAVFKKRIAFISPTTMLPASNNRYDQMLFMSSRRVNSTVEFIKALHGLAKVIRL